MSNETPSQETTFGYLSVIKSQQLGYLGGYLVVDALGRPLEFHCTAPVQPSRAQQILYGPTLEPFLVGEQIAGALLEAAKQVPRVIMTNHDAMLHARLGKTQTAIVLLRRAAADSASEHAIPGRLLANSSASTASNLQCSPGPQEALGKYSIEFPFDAKFDRSEVHRLLVAFAEQVELDEPFTRIAEAVCEAQRIDCAENHEQAA